MQSANYFTRIHRSTIYYSDVIMGAMASQITGVALVCSIVCSGTNQRKHQSSTSLAFVRGIHRWPVNSPQKASNAENISIWWRHHEAFGISLVPETSALLQQPPNPLDITKDGIGIWPPNTKPVYSQLLWLGVWCGIEINLIKYRDINEVCAINQLFNVISVNFVTGLR